VSNDNNAQIKMQVVQLMKCMICYSFENFAGFYSSTKSLKGFITYNFEHGIMAMNKHATNEHGLDLVKYMAHKNDLEGKDGGKQQKCKHKASITYNHTNFLENVRPYINATQFKWGMLGILF